MSGQDATLTMEQAKRQQERISAGQAGTGMHQGPMKSGDSKCDPICEKVSHQGK
jgi:hypothetical protein